jgi:hypothetical protein
MLQVFSAQQSGSAWNNNVVNAKNLGNPVLAVVNSQFNSTTFFLIEFHQNPGTHPILV